MILNSLGKLCAAQDLTTDTATDSQNVIQVAAVDWAQYTDIWWVVDTETVAGGDGSDTYQFQLLLATEAGLDTTYEVLSRTVTGATSYSIATAGNHIVCANIGKMLNEILGTGLSSYYFLGMISTVSDGASISINAALSTTEPPTVSHSQSVVSNVTTPGVASAGSGY